MSLISKEVGIGGQSSNSGLVCCIHFRTNPLRKEFKIRLLFKLWITAEWALKKTEFQTVDKETGNHCLCQKCMAVNDR